MKHQKAIFITAILATLLFGIALGSILYQLTITNQMSIGVHRELEFRINDIAVTGYNWGEFADDETKNVTGELWNLGTVDHVTEWNVTISAGWTFTIDEWTLDTNKTITVDDYLEVTLRLTEVNAYAGDYEFGLDFNVVG